MIGLGLALLGQHYFSHRRVYARDGILMWCLAAVCFGMLAHRLRKEKQAEAHRVKPATPSDGRTWRLAAFIGGALLSLVAGLWARGLPPEADFVAPFAMWLVGVVSFTAGFAPVAGLDAVGQRLAVWASRVRAALRTPSGQRTAVALALLLLAGLLARAADLEHIPPNLGGDEGTWGMEGLAMLSDGLANPFATRWFSFPSMSFLAWGVGMRIFGETVAGLRALSALIGAATVLTTFLLADELWGRRIAWLAATLLASGHFHLHFSRLAVNNIADGLIVTLALWLVARGMRSRSLFAFALGGAVVGAGWYAYFGARLVGVLAIMLVFWWALGERFWRGKGVTRRNSGLRRCLCGMLVLAGTALVVAAPLLLHYAAHPNDLTERSRQVSIFASGWLAQEQIITGRSAASLLLQQLWKSVSAFNYTLDPTFWYGPRIPLLDTISGVLFLAGLVWAVLHFRKPANALLVTWLVLTVLVGWVITENPPSSQRLIIVTPALALLTSLGLAWLTDLGQRLLGGGAVLWKGITGLVLALIAALNLHYYFVDYTPTRYYGNPTAETATVLARELVQQGKGCVVYFHGAPYIYWDFGTLRFMARGIIGVNIPPVGESEAQEIVVDPERGACFVFVPHRLPELDPVKAQYPTGSERRVYSEVDGRLLYVLYEVPVP